MTIKLSVLKVYALLFLAACLGFTIYNYEELSANEGWGVVGMIGLAGVGLSLFVVDIVIHNLVKNRIMANIIGFAVAFIVTLMIVFESLF